MRYTRARRGLSQEELGFRASLHRNYVGALERGEINPTFRVLLKLATIRRWIHSGRLRAERVGTRHVIKERDLTKAAHSDMLPLPKGWDRMVDGEPMPDIVAFLRESRAGR